MIQNMHVKMSVFCSPATVVKSKSTLSRKHLPWCNVHQQAVNLDSSSNKSSPFHVRQTSFLLLYRSGYVVLFSLLLGFDSSTKVLAKLQSACWLNSLKTAAFPFWKISFCHFEAVTETLSLTGSHFIPVSGETCFALSEILIRRWWIFVLFFTPKANVL